MLGTIRMSSSDSRLSGRVTTGHEKGLHKKPMGTAYKKESLDAIPGTKININDGSRIICAGTLFPNGHFVKAVQDRHILRLPKTAIAIQESVLESLESKSCHTVIAKMTDQNGKRLSAPLHLFRTHGFRVSRGFGEQVALPLSWWKDMEREELQPSLFGGVLL